MALRLLSLNLESGKGSGQEGWEHEFNAASEFDSYFTNGFLPGTIRWNEQAAPQ